MNTELKTNNNSNESIARKLVFTGLLAVEKGLFAEQAINDALQKTTVSREDRALITELIYGVTRNRIYLDHVISQFLNKPSRKISSALRMILRMGVYQLLYLDRIPVRAVINESTLQARRLLSQAMAGLVNGLLRKVSANISALTNEPLDEVGELCNYYSHPKWLVQRWFEEYGASKTRSILKFNNSRPCLVIRINTGKIPYETFVMRLHEQNIELGNKHPEFNSVEIRSLGKPVSSIKGFKEGYFLVQDIASQIIPGLLKIQGRHRILDACAAPGNKSFHIASALNPSGELIVCDINELRLNETQKNLKRLGIVNFRALCGDCSDEAFRKSLGWFDRILVDAPCSSLGVLRHNPEVKYTINQQGLRNYSNKQIAILQSISNLIKPTGIIVYSVCSSSREETLDVAECFISDNPQFTIDPITNDIFGPAVRIDKNGFLSTFPPSCDLPTDGFFAARFRRI